VKLVNGDFSVLKFFSKSFAVLAGIVVGAAILPLTAISQFPPPVVSDPPSAFDPTSPDAQGLSVIQGQVKNIQGNIVTVKTPDLPPYCPPNRVCPAIIVVGPTFTVDISRAIFQSASGRRQSSKPKLKLGDFVVVAGRLGPSLPVVLPSPGIPPQSLTAVVVSKAVPVPVPLPTPVP
jgi:hypothetical protein